MSILICSVKNLLIIVVDSSVKQRVFLWGKYLLPTYENVEYWKPLPAPRQEYGCNQIQKWDLLLSQQQIMQNVSIERKEQYIQKLTKKYLKDYNSLILD